MTEYHIQQNSRCCAQTGRELKAGEKYFSVLIEENGKFLRQDYCVEVWKGPPEGVFSFWKGQINDQPQDKKPQFDDELLMDCFQRLEGQDDPNKLNFRYVVALLLMRRKRLKFEESQVNARGEFLVLRDVRSKKKVEVFNPQLAEEEMISVQEQVFQILGWE